MQCKFCILSNEIMLYRIRSILPKFYNRVQLQTDLHHSRSTSHKIFSCTIQVITQFHRNLYLLPATKLGQGYVFTRVCDSVHMGRWCLPQCMLGYTPWEQTPPPQKQTPPKSRPPRSRPPRAVHAGRYGQQAGGMHPTGMHTCFN